jgi:hypothetical protein
MESFPESDDEDGSCDSDDNTEDSDSDDDSDGSSSNGDFVSAAAIDRGYIEEDVEGTAGPLR